MAKQSNNRNNNGNKDMLGVVLIIISVFLLLCITIPPILSVVSEAIFAIILGVFGIAAYPILAGLLFWGICLMLRQSFYMTTKNVICTILLIFFGLIILQLASSHAFLRQNYAGYIASCYDAKYTVGGVIMGTVAFGLKTAITEVGCYVVFSLAVLVVIAIMTKLVSRIKQGRKRKSAPIAKMPPAPDFTTRRDAQNVVPIEAQNGLFLGTVVKRGAPVMPTVERRDAQQIRQDTGNVTQPQQAPQPQAQTETQQSENQYQTPAQMMLYGDSDRIKKKSIEEFKASEKNNDAAVNPAPAQSYTFTGDDDLVEPYERTEIDASSAQKPKPKKIVHDSPNVFFPTEKRLDFNDDGIENADDIARRLQEDAQRRKWGAEFKQKNTEEQIKQEQKTENSREFFTPIKRNEPVIENDEPIIDIDEQNKGQSAVNNGGGFPTSATNTTSATSGEHATSPESLDEKFLRNFGKADTFTKFTPTGYGDDDIINGDIALGTGSAAVESDNDLGGDEPEFNQDEIILADEATPPQSDESQFTTSSDDVNDADIIDGNETARGADETASKLTISDEPAVDLSERSDNNSDLISGDDLSGMYTPVEQYKQKSKKGPIDNQISIQSVIDEKTEETVIPPPRRHKQYSSYTPPPIDLLKKYQSDDMSEEDLNRNASILETVISGFLKSEVKVVNIVPGPTVTRYELECPTGVPVKQIESHSQDIEYELAAPSHIRIEAPIPGKRAVGIEVPNIKKSIVGIREIIESDEFIKAKSPMTFVVGKDISGSVVLCDLEKTPHLLIAGQTGSGKSACLNGLIVSLLYKSSPEDLRFILVDPKRVEFSAYAGMPHLLFNNIIYEPNEVLNALKWGVAEMERRYSLLQRYKCNQLSAFNRIPDVVNGKIDKMPHIVIIIDELADIMQSQYKRDIEEKIKTIAAKARAAGIHLIVATQRPSADVLTGTIKTNLTSRIAFRVSGQTDSRIILDVQGAEALVGKGDMLFFPVDYTSPKRVQGSFISPDEVATVIGYIRDNVECDFDDEAMNAVYGSEDTSDGGGDIGGAGGGKAEDPLIPDVLAFFIQKRQASTSTIQRRFAIGFARASRIMDILEDAKYIGPVTGNSKPRDVFITAEQFKELYGRDVNEDN